MSAEQLSADMRRRELLAGVATATVSGCVRGDGGTEVDSRFTGENCPSFEEDESRCYHEVGTQPDVYLVPERGAGDPREEEVSFTLYNDGDDEFSANFYNWRIDRLVDEEWRKVVPWLVSQPLRELPAGESHTWTVNADTEATDGERIEASESTPTLRHPGSGTYAFSIDGPNQRHVALFEMEGEADFEPVGVESVEEENGVVVAEMERGDDENVVEVSVTESDRNVNNVWEGLAVQSDVIVNSVSLYDDETDEVSLRGGRRIIESFDHLDILSTESVIVRDDDSFYFGYDGTVYEVTMETVRTEEGNSA